MWCRSVFLGGTITPLSQGGAGPQRPPIFCNLAHARTQYEKERPNFCIAIKLDVRKYFYTVDYTNADARSVCGSSPSCFISILVLPLIIMVRKDYYYSYTVSVNQPADSVGAV